MSCPVGMSPRRSGRAERTAGAVPVSSQLDHGLSGTGLGRSVVVTPAPGGVACRHAARDRFPHSAVPSRRLKGAPAVVRPPRSFGLACLLFTVLVPMTARAQPGLATVTGLITDNSGAAVP